MNFLYTIVIFLLSVAICWWVYYTYYCCGILWCLFVNSFFYYLRHLLLVFFSVHHNCCVSFVGWKYCQLFVFWRFTVAFCFGFEPIGFDGFALMFWWPQIEFCPPFFCPTGPKPSTCEMISYRSCVWCYLLLLHFLSTPEMIILQTVLLWFCFVWCGFEVPDIFWVKFSFLWFLFISKGQENTVFTPIILNVFCSRGQYISAVNFFLFHLGVYCFNLCFLSK